MRLEAKDVTFSYGRRKVLSSLSFSVSGGETMALLGRNGSGKTTLMRILLGFLSPESGTVTINGRNIMEMTGRERAAAVAYIPQQTDAVYPYTVLESVVMGTAPALSLFQRPGRKEEERARSALEMLGIDHLEHRPVSQISGGERQLTMIARSLVQDAEILLLDEPTASLDYSNQILVMENAERLRRKGYAVIFSTHDPSQALNAATSVLALSCSSVLYSGAPEGLKDGSVLTALYGRPIRVEEIESGNGRQSVCIPE